jgi:23S rRNA pseudouridine1911/1915/1917 synthase
MDDLPPLRVLYEDNHCLAIWKPAGALSAHFEGTEETLDRQVKAYLKAKYDKPGNVFLGVVHRLDRPVTGVLLYARTSKAAARLVEQFREGQVEKVYWAVLEGRWERPAGSLQDWLWKDGGTGRVQVVTPAAPGGKQALLDFARRGEAAGQTWLEVRPRTGRTHQIRVQFASRGHPVVGDAKYGARRALAEGIALHARSLSFRHPTRDETVTLTAPLPAAWHEFQLLGIPAEAWE